MKRLYFLMMILAILSCEKEEPDTILSNCEITDLTATTGACNDAGNYELTIDFNVNSDENQSFDLFVRNNELIGNYSISDLPIVIPNFEPSGLDFDFIKVCINDNLECCAAIEFAPAECSSGECEITDLTAITGACNDAGNYELTVDFNVNSDENQSFDLFVRNNELIGNYSISDLPIVIPNFEPSGLDFDFIKVCINDNPNCCAAIEFAPAECSSGECEITDLTAITGACNDDGSYVLTIDYNVTNADNQSFDLFVRNNEFIGYYSISDLPVVIPNFEPSGSDYDLIKVCVNDNPDCCAAIEFAPAECSSGECEITDLTAITGACNDDGSYVLTIDFNVTNADNQSFDLFVRNNEFIGYYSISDLPIVIPNFEPSGLDDDFIRVCINDNPNCCAVMEFAPADCL